MNQFNNSTPERVAPYETTGIIELVHKINSKFRNASRLGFVIMLTSSLLTVTIGFNILYSYFSKWDIIWFPFPNDTDTVVFFVGAVIIAPLFETWFNQSLPYTLLNKVKYFRERSPLILLASAIFFGINHFYSMFYILFGFFMGLLLMYGYMVRIKTDNKTYLLIAISHSLINLTGFIHNLF